MFDREFSNPLLRKFFGRIYSLSLSAFFEMKSHSKQVKIHSSENTIARNRKDGWLIFKLRIHSDSIRVNISIRLNF